MKKLLAALLLAAMLLTSAAFAEDLGVQIIGEENKASDELMLDDMKLGQSYRIDGYAIVEPLAFDYYDCFAQYELDFPGDNSHGNDHSGDSAVVYWDSGSWYYPHACWNDSSTNADFAWLTIDLTNLRKSDVKFMEEITVKVIYDDEYEYAGWVRQFNHNYFTPVYRKAHEGKYYVVESDEKFEYTDFALDPANEEAVGQMYTGSYVFGCTLPNAVVNGKEPLRMEIKLGNSELTYNIRK